MQYHYTASEHSGKVVDGDIDAQSPAAVLDWMVQHGLRPITIKVAAVGGSKILGGKFSPKVTIEDKVFLTKYLALMLSVGTDLFRAIDILIADFEKPAMKALLVEMKDSLGKGQPFYTTFARYPKFFSPVFVSVIRAAELSGSLDDTLDKLSADLERQQELHNRIKGALVYPVILVILSLVVLFSMVTFVLPKISESFLSSTAETPIFSQVVFAIGFFFKDNLILILLFITLSTLGSWIFLRKTVVGIRFMSRMALKIPVVKNVIRKIALQRFAATLGSLIRSGTPIIESLDITANSAGDGELKDALFRISREGLAKGLTIGEAFKKEPYFPSVVINLIAISEKSGHIEEVLETLAGFYESEIDSSIKGLVSFLEPALLVFIGGIVGLIAVSIIIPIYQLVGQI